MYSRDGFAGEGIVGGGAGRTARGAGETRFLMTGSFRQPPNIAPKLRLAARIRTRTAMYFARRERRLALFGLVFFLDIHVAYERMTSKR